MAKPENESEKQTWSTWEELLLAYAVNRHGIDSWTTIAAEIQKHNNSKSRTITGLDCRHKYNDLKQRFSDESEISSSVSWLEELRKLRVDELRREVQRYDLSISSLQLKVKRLEDEREERLKEMEISDLEETKENHCEPVIEALESPDLKDDGLGTGSEDLNRDREIAEPNRIEEKPDSCRGSCESESEKEGNDSPESMDESRETSDVQSSASLSRKEIQPDNEDQTLTVDEISVESQPLIDFIEILQSHPIGSHFSRRLENQEPSEYEKVIRQHIDFEMIRARVEEGYYKSSKSKFFRDLLLVINNARVVYGERTSEFNAAKELNQLIKTEMMTNQTSLPPKEESLVTYKEEEATVSSLKPKMSLPIVACRKRSSLAVRASASVTEPLKKKSKSVATIVDEKPVSEEEKEDETSDKDEEPILPKKMSKGRAPAVAKKVGSKNAKTSLNASSEPKKNDVEKKGNNAIGGSKKQGAASFLKRMKGVSSSETVVKTVKADSSNGKRSNSKNEKDDAEKAPAGQKRSSGKKPAAEKGSPAKKNTSTVSKRGVRGSEASEKEAGSSARQKKRSRRL